ncbi:hypothetical protein lerEdw1_006632, partial [Lerista edwardsae]
ARLEAVLLPVLLQGRKPRCSCCHCTEDASTGESLQQRGSGNASTQKDRESACASLKRGKAERRNWKDWPSGPSGWPELNQKCADFIPINSSQTRQLEKTADSSPVLVRSISAVCAVGLRFPILILFHLSAAKKVS